MREHTRGDSFVRTYQISVPGVTDWSEWTVTGQVRAYFEDGELLGQLQFDWVDVTAGTFSVSVLDTEHWPIGVVFHDMEFRKDGFVFSTPVERTKIKADVSKGA